MRIIYKKPTIVFISIFLMLINTTFAQTLTIAAAANFRDPMAEIVKIFKIENPSIEVKTIFGSSGNLYNQIMNNAPFDLFFSANTNYPQKIFEAGLSYNLPKIYAIGQVVLWSRRVDVSEGLTVLKKSGVRRIALANPELAPYGRGAKQCLVHYDLLHELSSKLVTAENIAQAAQFAVTGNADVAFIAKSQLNIEAIKGKGTIYEIPIEFYDPIEQAFVRIKKEDNEVITQKFAAFLNKPEIQQIIKKYGYNLIANE